MFEEHVYFFFSRLFRVNTPQAKTIYTVFDNLLYTLPISSILKPFSLSSFPLIPQPILFTLNWLIIYLGVYLVDKFLEYYLAHSKDPSTRKFAPSSPFFNAIRLFAILLILIFFSPDSSKDSFNFMVAVILNYYMILLYTFLIGFTLKTNHKTLSTILFFILIIFLIIQIFLVTKI